MSVCSGPLPQAPLRLVAYTPRTAQASHSLEPMAATMLFSRRFHFDSCFTPTDHAG